MVKDNDFSFYNNKEFIMKNKNENNNHNNNVIENISENIDDKIEENINDTNKDIISNQFPKPFENKNFDLINKNEKKELKNKETNTIYENIITEQQNIKTSFSNETDNIIKENLLLLIPKFEKAQKLNLISNISFQTKKLKEVNINNNILSLKNNKQKDNIKDIPHDETFIDMNNNFNKKFNSNSKLFFQTNDKDNNSINTSSIVNENKHENNKSLTA